MNRAVGLSICLVLLCSSVAFAVDLESFSFGVHFIPSVQRTTETRQIDVSFSFEAKLKLDEVNTLSVLAMLDPTPTSLGTSFQFDHQITDSLRSGLGVTVLSTFSEDGHLGWPIFSLYAHAAGRTYFYPELWAESGISFPVVTFAEREGGWELLPLSELPTLYGAVDARIASAAGVQARVTLQPVITDTTALQNPIWPISDNLLVLPMSSVFLRYVH